MTYCFLVLSFIASARSMFPSVGVEAAVVADVAGDFVALRMARALAFAGNDFVAPGAGFGLSVGESTMVKDW